MNIILTGFMGTGKTSVGKRLAKRLGWQFVDIDQLIELSAGRSIATIFTERGEAVFRRLERRCISRIVRKDHQVVSTGGGAFLDPHNRTRLKFTGPVVCLTARPKVLVARLGPRLHVRPLLKGHQDPLVRIKTLLAQRAASYARADIMIDTSDVTLEQVVEQLWHQFSAYQCKSWQYLLDHADQLSRRYGGKYVVMIDERVVGSGDTQLEAYQNTPSRLTGKPDAGIYYIPLPGELAPAR